MWPTIPFSAVSALLKFLQQQKHNSKKPTRFHPVEHYTQQWGSYVKLFVFHLVRMTQQLTQFLTKTFQQVSWLVFRGNGEIIVQKKALKIQVH